MKRDRNGVAHFCMFKQGRQIHEVLDIPSVIASLALCYIVSSSLVLLCAFGLGCKSLSTSDGHARSIQQSGIASGGSVAVDVAGDERGSVVSESSEILVRGKIDIGLPDLKIAPPNDIVLKLAKPDEPLAVHLTGWPTPNAQAREDSDSLIILRGVQQSIDQIYSRLLELRTPPSGNEKSTLVEMAQKLLTIDQHIIDSISDMGLVVQLLSSKTSDTNTLVEIERKCEVITKRLGEAVSEIALAAKWILSRGNDETPFDGIEGKLDVIEKRIGDMIREVLLALRAHKSNATDARANPTDTAPGRPVESPIPTATPPSPTATPSPTTTPEILSGEAARYFEEQIRTLRALHKEMEERGKSLNDELVKLSQTPIEYRDPTPSEGPLRGYHVVGIGFIIMIILAAGAFGGLVSIFATPIGAFDNRTRDERKTFEGSRLGGPPDSKDARRWENWSRFLSALAAAAFVPGLLFLIRSELLSVADKSPNFSVALFSICLIAATIGSPFIRFVQKKAKSALLEPTPPESYKASAEVDTRITDELRRLTLTLCKRRAKQSAVHSRLWILRCEAEGLIKRSPERAENIVQNLSDFVLEALEVKPNLAKLRETGKRLTDAEGLQEGVIARTVKKIIEVLTPRVKVLGT